MSIFSSIKSAVSSAYNKVTSGISSAVNTVLGRSNQSAAAYNYTGSSQNNVASGATSKVGGTTYYNNFTPTTARYGDPATNGPTVQLRGSGINGYSTSGYSSLSSSPFMTTQLPVTISSGKSSSVGGGSVLGATTQNYSASAFSAPITTRSLSAGGTTQGAVQTGGGSMGAGGTFSSSPYAVPQQYKPTDPGSPNTTGLAGSMAGYYARKDDGTFEPVTQDPFAEKSDAAIAKEKAQMYKDAFGEPQSVYNDPQVQQAQADRRAAQQALQAPTAQLNAVLAQAQRDTLQLRQTAQKEGVVEAVYGNQASAINYNAAIAALPLQSNIAALQGNLELADSYLNELVTMKKDQIKTQYDYNKGLFDTIYSALDAKEKRVADSMVKENDRQYKSENDLIDYKAQLIASINSQGGSDSHVRITAVERAKDKVSAARAAGNMSSTGSGKLEIKSVNGTDMLFNPATGEVSPINGGAAIPGAVDPTQKSLDQLSFLRDTASQASELASASGASGISKFLGDTFVGDTKYRQLEALTNTLKTNVLSLMTDPNIKKFFGPQMSNADVLLMTSAGTTLNPSANTGTQIKSEIKRLDDLFNRMQTAVKLGSTSSMNVITAPTGEIIRITD